MTYRILKHSQKVKCPLYFGGHICENTNRWVMNVNESNIYFDKRQANKDIKKYKLKNCVVISEK